MTRVLDTALLWVFVAALGVLAWTGTRALGATMAAFDELDGSPLVWTWYVPPVAAAVVALCCWRVLTRHPSAARAD